MLRTAWRSLRHHKLRLVLSGVAIVLGVGFVVGTLIFDSGNGRADASKSNNPQHSSAQPQQGLCNLVRPRIGLCTHFLIVEVNTTSHCQHHADC